MNDFSAKTKTALLRKGIRLIGLTVIPGSGDLPFANGERGYRIDDNGCCKIWTFAQVCEAAK